VAEVMTDSVRLVVSKEHPVRTDPKNNVATTFLIQPPVTLRP